MAKSEFFNDERGYGYRMVFDTVEDAEKARQAWADFNAFQKVASPEDWKNLLKDHVDDDRT